MAGNLKRISIRHRRFDGIPSPSETSIDVVVVGVAYVSRMYYESAYNPDKVSAPTCWSANTEVPAEDVPEDQRQSARCLDCVHNIRGSGKGQSRACRFVQRLAVVLEEDLETVYQLQLPPTSIFGDAISGDMPLRAYARYLEARETPIVGVTTKIYFDGRSDIPKLFFRPIRPLEEQEVEIVTAVMKHPDTISAITLNVVPMEDEAASPFSVVDGFNFND